MTDRKAAARPLLAALAMFSGVALLLNILGGISLRTSLAWTGTTR